MPIQIKAYKSSSFPIKTYITTITREELSLTQRLQITIHLKLMFLEYSTPYTPINYDLSLNFNWARILKSQNPFDKLVYQNYSTYAFIMYTVGTHHQESVLKQKKLDLPHRLPVPPKNDQKWCSLIMCIIHHWKADGKEI